MLVLRCMLFIETIGCAARVAPERQVHPDPACRARQNRDSRTGGGNLENEPCSAFPTVFHCFTTRASTSTRWISASRLRFIQRLAGTSLKSNELKLGEDALNNLLTLCVASHRKRHRSRNCEAYQTRRRLVGNPLPTGSAACRVGQGDVLVRGQANGAAHCAAARHGYAR